MMVDLGKWENVDEIEGRRKKQRHSRSKADEARSKGIDNGGISTEMPPCACDRAKVYNILG